MIYIEKNDIHCTLCTYLYCSFWMKWSLEQQGKQSYINWPAGKSLIDLYDKKKFNEQPNMYLWYFRQSLQAYTIDDRLTWESWVDPSPVPFMAQPLQVIKDYYKKHLIFNDTINERGQELVNKYNIDFSKMIGVTWRGTDIYLESRYGYEGRRYTPIDFYFKWIDKALEQIPDARIACTAEEEGVLDPLFKRYPQAFLIEEFYQAPKGGKQNPERFSPKSGYERGIQPVLMVWLFSKCAWLIKNRASTSAVASWLSNGEIVNINHTEILGFPPHIDGVEYKGEVYK